MLQSAILALVRRLTEWLSTDAIRFEVLFVQDGEKKPLADEAALVELLLREPIERGDGAGRPWLPDKAAVVTRLNRLSRRRRSTASRPRPSRSRWTWTTWSSRNWS